MQTTMKMHKKQFPAPMSDYFELTSHKISRRNNETSVKGPKIKTTVVQRGFFYQGATLYNSLPLQLRKLENDTLLYSKLRTFEF